MPNVKNIFIRLLFTILMIGIGLKQMQESNNSITSCQDNISKSKNLLYSINITELGKLYIMAPRLILIMNLSIIIASILFLFKIDGYILLLNNFMIIQFLLVNNILLDNSSKCYLVASAYLSIYGSFYYFTRCPICEFCRREGIAELMPALCATDEVMFRLQHGTLHREHTIAAGDPICDYWITGDQMKEPR